MNVDIPQWSGSSSSEEEDINCIRKSHIETVNDEIKGSSSKEEDIEVCKFSRRGRVEIMNKEVKRWTYSSKQLEAPPEITNTKEEISL